MKIYQFVDGRLAAMELTEHSAEPVHTAEFELAEGQSHFAARYSVVEGVLTDNFVGKSDEEVALEIHAAETAKAEALVAAREAAAKAAA